MQGLFGGDCNFNYAVKMIFENVIGFFYFAERETVSDKRGGVDFALFD